MELLERLGELLAEWDRALGVTAVVAVGLWFARRLLLGKLDPTDKQLPRQVAMLALTCIGILAIFLATPLDKETQGQVLSLVGLVFTGVIALSSTTFVANIMGGFMLRAVRSFRPGDFIRIGDHFGRVTERGLFHTEIQTEDRDLVTLPNLFVVTNPVRVVRDSGTVVSVQLSLGYDVPRGDIESQLKSAADDVGLADAFVHVKELGDFSVTYMVAGFLGDIERLLTTRSRLRCAVLDRLHGANIEIVSPTFMNQRALDPKNLVVPSATGGASEGDFPGATNESTAESVAFDKASKAGDLESLRDEVIEIQKQLADSPREMDRIALERRKENLQARIDRESEGLSEL